MKTRKLILMTALLLITLGINAHGYALNQGDIITLGRYEQDNDDSNGREPIQWVVMDEKDGVYELTTAYCLDHKCYNDSYESVGWEDSTLRWWLNNVFILSFSDEEMNHIVALPTVTLDRDYAYVPIINPYGKNHLLYGYPTKYAVAAGVAVNDETGYCGYWGVSALAIDRHGYMAPAVTRNGTISDGTSVDKKSIAVRPYIHYVENVEDNPSLKHSLNDTSIGDIVLLGRYEQDNVQENGDESLEWYVIAIEDGKALLLSRRCIKEMSYNTSNGGTYWESCSLRKWLNSDFYNEAFSEEEKELIIETTLLNGTMIYGNAKAGSDTVDNVFVLSSEEMIQYMSSENGFNLLRRAWPSIFAKAESHVSSKYGVVNWWLRNSGHVQEYAMYQSDSSDNFSFDQAANSEGCYVRPAIWVNIN